MIVHRICFRYDGQLSEIGAMDVGYVERALTGARLVLAAHAHFMTTGKVPAQLVGTTELFRVVAIAPARAAVDLQFLIAMREVAEQARAQLGGDASATLTAEAALELSAELLSENLEAAVAAVAGKRSLPSQSDLRRRGEEAASRPLTGQLHKLQAKTLEGLELIAAPIARPGGCSTFAVVLDGFEIATLGAHAPERTRVPSADEYRRIAEDIIKERNSVVASLII